MLIRQPMSEKEHLEHITRVLVTTALNMRPLVTAGINDVLKAAMDHELPSLKTWFHDETLAIVSGKKNDNGQPRWGDVEANNIVTATLCQVRIRPEEPRARILWLTVLADPKYATTALQAFFGSAKDLASHLGVWWNRNPPDREKDLGTFVAKLLELEKKKSKLRLLIKHEGSSWTPDLRMAVNEELFKLGQPRIFPPLRRKKTTR